MAKIIATELKTEEGPGLLVGMTKGEWRLFRILSGVPCGSESFSVGTTLSINKAQEAVEAFTNMQQVRKDMITLQKKWGNLMESMDVETRKTNQTALKRGMEMGSLLIAGKLGFNTRYCCPVCGKVSQTRRQGLINNEIVWREYPCGHRVEFTRAEWLIGVAR